MYNNKPTYISLFSSAGVGCYGFKQERFECIATNELIERRIKVQEFNSKCKYQTGYICGDVTSPEIKAALFREIEFWKKHEGLKEVDVVIATPPCQGMSVANHKKADNEIKRNSLVVESIKIIQEIKPRFFIFENVSAFMKTACTDVDGQVKTIGEAIDTNLGKVYSICPQVINFKNYGSCSSRTRTLVIGVRYDLSDHISPIELFPDYQEEKTLRETIGMLKPLKKFGEIDSNDIYHEFRAYPEHMRGWISELKEGESAFDNTDPTRIPHRIVDGKVVYNQNKNADKYRRQIWDKVGPCIHTRNDQFASQNTIHPEDDRVFSIRELMRMMTIPDDFKWVEMSVDELNQLSTTKKKAILKKEEIKIRQSIGEAVPTAIFKGVAKKISFFLSQTHLSASEIAKEIELNNLVDNGNLLNYICEKKTIFGVDTLSRIAELTNTQREQHAAFFTNKSLINTIVCSLPSFETDCIRILEPSVGVGNFIPLVAKKYNYIKDVFFDVVDIDQRALDILKELVSVMNLPHNIHIKYICADFLTHKFNTVYDLVIGNPPFSKLPPHNKMLKMYREGAFNQQTSNTFSFFLEKAIRNSKYVAMITPKYLLNTPEFKLTRDLLEQKNVEAILDFGESGFKGVLVETIAVLVNTTAKPGNTFVFSEPENKKLLQKQAYIFDHKYPYWLIYRNKNFDDIANKMQFSVFNVFRDRQITKKILKRHGTIRVLKSRNIAEDGSGIINIDEYDSYIEETDAKKLSVYEFLDNTDVYLTPNMSYKPRVIKKPMGVLVNGSAAILILKEGQLPLSNKEMEYFASDEYRTFYKVARNYQTRSLNIDANSVFFFGRLNKGEM